MWIICPFFITEDYVCFCVQGDCASCIHAIIKYHASDASFTLRDINSVLGVYVNDCRIQNSAVKLEHNDLIRFGYTGIAYEFLLECQPKVLNPFTADPVKALHFVILV